MRRLLDAPLLLAFLLASGFGGAADRAEAREPFSIAPPARGGPLVGYDARAGRAAFTLPTGIASADWHAFYTAVARRAATELREYEPRTGTLLLSGTVPGRWTLGGVSATGEWLGFSQPRSSGTELALVDARAWRIARRLDLHGRYEVETVSADGKAIFLIHRLGPLRYSVLVYDLAASQLRPAILREKGQVEAPVMTGEPGTSVATPDGFWLLTLYVNTRDRKAFVHALNLASRSALCIDLPSGGHDLDELRAYSLTADPFGGLAYAANPRLGLVARVQLGSAEPVHVYPLPARGPAGPSAVSRDRRTVYLASGNRLWAYDDTRGAVRGPYLTGARVTGLTFSRGGHRLYAVTADGRVQTFAAATGEALAL